MSERDIHAKRFDDGTRIKLDIYRRYLREWLPVFLNSAKREIAIFDYFAGPGRNEFGEEGSPLIALDEIGSALEKHGNKNRPEIKLYFNEFNAAKCDELMRLCEQHPIVNKVQLQFQSEEFQTAFRNWSGEMTRNNVAQLLFLDQYGVKQVDRDVFEGIIRMPYTDVLFYISSSTIHRFDDNPAIVGAIEATKDGLRRMTGSNVHRVVCDEYRKFVPEGVKYYLSPFSIKKGSNVYGLVFGSANELGAEKFLSLCWKTDPIFGEANFDIYGEHIQRGQMYFLDLGKPKKLQVFEDRLRDLVPEKTLTTFSEVYRYALSEGFLPKHAREFLKKMMKDGLLPKQSICLSYDSCRSTVSPVRILLKE